MTGQSAPLVEVRGLVKQFSVTGHRGAGLVKAVTDVDLDIGAGETLGLVGKSGSGKTTLARCILRLLEPTAGSIRLEGIDIAHLGGEGLRRMRPRMQVVFQDPVGSLDPRMSVFDLIAEPLYTHRSLSRTELRANVERLIDEVGLARNLRDRRAHELSGGQCQRVAIARAISLQPRLLILDEPTSALDVSVQAQVLELLVRLRAEHDLTYLLISHDLGVVRYLCERVAVMYLGRIVEQGPTRQIFEAAQHPYTRALILARPDVDVDGPPRLLLTGEDPQRHSATVGLCLPPALLAAGATGAAGGMPHERAQHDGQRQRPDRRLPLRRPDRRPFRARGEPINRTIGIVAAQVAPVPYDREATFRSFERHVRTLAAVFPNLELYVFPEVYLTALGSWDDGYPSGYVESVAEPIGGTLTQRISELSRSVGKWIVPGSIYEASGGDVYNTALVFDPQGELVARYRKIMPWMPYETTRPGTELTVFDIPDVGRFRADHLL